jgi:hypothetical protein
VFILSGWRISIVAIYISVFQGRSSIDRKTEEEYPCLKKEQEGR